jgi:transposase
MWRRFTNSIEPRAPNCRIVYDKFHVLQHVNKAIDEVRAEEGVPLQKNKKVVATSPACGIPAQERGVYCANKEGLCCNK